MYPENIEINDVRVNEGKTTIGEITLKIRKLMLFL
jgi:hypothetical protein